MAGANPDDAAACGRGERRRRHRRGAIGAPPGTLLVDPTAPPPRLRAIAYDQATFVDEQDVGIERVRELRARGGTLWLDVTGLGDVELLRRLGEVFGLHRLALEDIVGSHQRAKVEDYPGHQFVVVRMLDAAEACETEQFALCLGDGFLVTFQERPGDCFDAVRNRLRDQSGRMRGAGPDYLAYALLDAVVDAYFPALEAIGDRLAVIEGRVLEGVGTRILGDLHEVRRDLLVARRALWPLREATASLVRGEATRFSADTRVYLRDVHDHVVQLIDLLENYRELGTSLMDLQLAATSNRLNEVMKVLTVIATIFIPLTFIVGIYGMNFDDMPELHTRYGYPAVMLGMLALAIAMLLWFRRRHWI